MWPTKHTESILERVEQRRMLNNPRATGLVDLFTVHIGQDRGEPRGSVLWLSEPRPA